jgi:hypothetical protein
MAAKAGRPALRLATRLKLVLIIISLFSLLIRSVTPGGCFFTRKAAARAFKYKFSGGTAAFNSTRRVKVAL